MLAISKIAKNRILYECKNCNYNTSNKSDFEKHTKTMKHKNNHLAIIGNQFVAKVAK